VTPSLVLETRLGDHHLQSPLIGSSGTVGSVVDFVAVTDWSVYGAAVAKSVSATPWPGRTAPRVAATGGGMLNSIGIQNPGVAAWVESIGSRLGSVPTQVWGSAVGKDAAEFAVVAATLSSTEVAAIEVNLSCPNLESGRMFALDVADAAEVVRSVREVTDLPIGAKLTPNSEDIVAIAAAVAEAGADWVVLGNTVWGAGFDIETRRPLLSAVVGGYSGGPIKPIALRCVWQVARALPGLPIVGTGGVGSGEDVVEFLLAGASAVGVGTAHFASPRIGMRIVKQLRRYMEKHGVASVNELIGAAKPW
jgi:dihydroorotate dehydrogenase (NAD+) catalytic subunit